jgi:predicted component of type VI protein secretion system
VTAQDLALVIGALASGLALVLGAIGALWVKLHSYQSQVDGRMAELLSLIKPAAPAQGGAESLRKYPPDWSK